MKKWWQKIAVVFAAILLLFIIDHQVDNSDSWSTWNLPLSGKVIVIDPGHGGVDGGADDKDDMVEKDVALNVSHNLREFLEEAGALVLMTRENDRDLADEDLKGFSRRKTQDLNRRVEFVKEAEADLLISIHLNAIPSPKWHGAQTFFHPRLEESENIAKFVQDAIRDNLENTNRYAKAINHVYLLKSVNIPGALIEVGFLSNSSEKELLKTEEYQKKVAASIYQGVFRYYTNEKVPES
jgi:N-acetylmuramoyl-L-alanine amidase